MRIRFSYWSWRNHSNQKWKISSLQIATAVKIFVKGTAKLLSIEISPSRPNQPHNDLLRKQQEGDERWIIWQQTEIAKGEKWEGERKWKRKRKKSFSTRILCIFRWRIHKPVASKCYAVRSFALTCSPPLDSVIPSSLLIVIDVRPTFLLPFCKILLSISSIWIAAPERYNASNDVRPLVETGNTESWKPVCFVQFAFSANVMYLYARMMFEIS